MSINQNERSRHVGKAIAETTAKALKLSPPDVMEVFDELKNIIFVDNFDESETLEIQRRIAEAKISVLAGKEISKEFENAWNDIENLGYSDAEREASMVFYRAQFLIDKDLLSEASIAIERLGELISTFKNQRLIDHFSQVYTKLSSAL